MRNIVLPDDAPLTSEFRPDLLGGAGDQGARVRPRADAQGGVERPEQDLLAIPMRRGRIGGRGQMIVWVATSDKVARPTPWPTVA